MHFKALCHWPETARPFLTKIMRIMKLSAILLFVCCMQVSATTYSQKVNLHVKKGALKEVFTAIRLQTGYSFFYNAVLLKQAKPVDLDLTNVDIREAMDKALFDQPLSYSIDDSTIIIKSRPVTNLVSQELDATLSPPIPITGTVTDSVGNPMEGASIFLKKSHKSVTSDHNGRFTINVSEGDILVVSFVGYSTRELKITASILHGEPLNISLARSVYALNKVEVTYSNGYQTVSPERSTGSYSQIDNTLITRSVTTNILDRIENLTPGIQFNHGDADPSGHDGILIRGRSTIYSNVAPLIVLDNFPYDGDITNINPNDIESISILKDAAAASIWGARAGNGVIVITTKRGKSGRPQVDYTSSVTVSRRPDFSSLRTISSPDYVDLEKYLYANGHYSNDSLDNAYGIPDHIDPVGEVLLAQSAGTITAAQANAQLEAYKKNNIYNDLSKYFYRTSVSQQHSLNVSGSTPTTNYYMSLGWDHNVPNLVSQKYDRISLRSQNTFKITQNLDITAGLNYVQNNNQVGNNPGYSMDGLYPYARLADDHGNPIEFDNKYRKIFTDTASAGGQLLNWKNIPLSDIGNTKITNKIRDFTINIGLRYELFKQLSLDLKYQYENAVTSAQTYNSDSSFYTRDQINNYYQPGAANPFPIPIGGILDFNSSELNSHQGRAQLSYNRRFAQKHEIAAIAGWEIKDLRTTGNSYRLYGYNQNGSVTSPQMDFVSYFPQYFYGPYSSFVTAQIQNPQSVSGTLDRFISTFGNASYTYDHRYILSGSVRNDAANLFGVKTNQKGVPLWSAGAAWEINNEKFYRIAFLPYLKLRATYGVNGNFSRTASALSTAYFYQSNITPLNTGTIQNPPNPSLRWETVKIVNIALDFGTRNKILTGSIDYYQKHADDLISDVPTDPTLGLVQGAGGGTPDIFENSANMKGHGIDLELNSRNLDGRFKWYTTFIFSYVKTQVTKYLVPVSTNGSTYLTSTSIILPITGKPVYGIYSYRWGGLDPATGDPMGYLGKSASKDYNAITSNTKLDSMIFNGPVQPTTFGALRNTVSWKNFSLSFNISYKFGYYFRRPSVNYGNLFAEFPGLGTLAGSKDYSLRWQQPGDEKKTNVPSITYPANPLRDQLYLFSQILVDKADNIRLEDIRIDYTLDRSIWRQLPFRQVKLYIYTSNLGILWKANKDGIDPYYNNTARPARNISMGLNIGF